MSIIIDPEFKALIPPLSADEYKQLEEKRSNQIVLVNPNPDKIITALAEVWKLHLERETGRKVEVTWRRQDDTVGGSAAGD